MTIELSITVTWLLMGCTALIWFHLWRRGHSYARWWHGLVDYGAVILLGPISLLIMWRRKAIARRLRGL